MKRKNTLNYTWVIDDFLGFTNNNKEELFQESPLIESPFSTLVTIEKDDYRLIWHYNNSKQHRHYMYTTSNYPVISKWEVYEFKKFLNYEKKHNRNVLLWFKDQQVSETFIKEIINTVEDVEIPRPELLTHCTACYENGCSTKMLCHTSSSEDALHILQSGNLLSSNNVRKTDISTLINEDRNAASDPSDYFDYVMLSYGNCTAGDRLVNERRLGRFPTEEDLLNDFWPGVKFYFSTTHLESHPDFCLDGYHAGKVKDCLNLKDYLAFCVIPTIYKDTLEKVIPENIKERIIYIDPSEAKGLNSWAHLVYSTVLNS